MKHKTLEDILSDIRENGLKNLSPTTRHSVKLFDKLVGSDGLPRRVAENFRSDTDDTELAWDAVRRRLKVDRRREIRKFFPRGYLMGYALGGAAAALGAVALVMLLVYRPSPRPVLADRTAELPVDYGRMTLTDDGGRVIELGAMGTVVIDGQGTAVEWKDGLLTFRTEAPQSDHYRVTVPCGKSMRVALSDGSVVRLNALSTLRFPTGFGSERRVEMQGQAFFEVAAQDQNPFFVKAGEDVVVRVTGTRFDVAAYPDDPTVDVTLVEGGVEIEAGEWPVVALAPSEQASYNPADGQLSLRRVDTNIFTDWTEGLLVFEDRPLCEIMSSLARYYDIEPVFEDEAARKVPFGFKLPHYPEIEPIIELFSHISQVETVRRGRQIIFRSKNTHSR